LANVPLDRGVGVGLDRPGLVVVRSGRLVVVDNDLDGLA